MTIEFKDTLLRQRDLIPLEVLGTPITVIGAGAVGSWTALALVKMGFANIEVIDFDEIDVENMNCQFYPVSMIGEKKAQALNKMIKDFTGIDIKYTTRPFTKGDKFDSGIVIAAVDSMKIRREIFDACGVGVEALIDPRMGAEIMSMYTMKPSDPRDLEAYVASWHSDEDSVHERCTAKSTIYCANILAGFVASNVKKIATKQNYCRVLTFDIPSMGMNAWNKEQHETQKEIQKQVE